MKPAPILLTEAEAAEALRLSSRTLRKARQDGHLRYVLIGRAVRYTPADLESFVATIRQVQPQCPQPSPPARTAAPRRGRAGAVIVPFHQRNAGKPGGERL